MAARNDRNVREETVQAVCPGADVLSDCRCRPAVERAFCGMLLTGASEREALEVAERVYRFHHPELPTPQAREVVHIWVYRGQLHQYKPPPRSVAEFLATYTKSAYDRKSQDLRMWIAGGGLLTGVLLVPLLPRVLPFAADTHVAAIVMGQDRWNAGVTMMRTADPGGWRSVVDASQLARDNAEAIGRCAQAARGRPGSAMHDHRESANAVV